MHTIKEFIHLTQNHELTVLTVAEGSERREHIQNEGRVNPNVKWVSSLPTGRVFLVAGPYIKMVLSNTTVTDLD